MSVNVMSAVWEQSKSNGNDRLVLLYIANCANDDGESWPGVKRIARYSAMSERAVQYSLKRLVELGELDIEYKSSKLGTNIYRVTLGGANPAPVVQTSAPGVVQNNEGVVQATAPGVVQTSAPNTSVEPSDIKSNYRGDKKSELLRWFDELWKRYPHYGGMGGGRSNRKESEKVFLQLKPSVEDMKRIAQALENAKKSKKWTDDGGQFVESMQKWLRSEPWNNIPLGEEQEERVIRRGNYTFYPATGDLVDKFGRKMKGELQPSGVIKTSVGTFIDLEGREKS